MSDPTFLTDVDHWQNVHRGRIRLGLPSRLMPGSVTICNLLARYVDRPGMSVLEIGCAPGKALAYVHLKLGARTTGIDYSEPGVRLTKEVHRTLGVESNILQEDLFHTSLERGTFDLVFSNGLIEHFSDPLPALQTHVELLRSGGRLLVTLPDYSRVYGWLQARFDPPNLALHNVSIMTPEALLRLAQDLPLSSVEAYLVGRPNPILVHWHKKLGRIFGGAVLAGLTGLSRIQPFEIRPLRPLLVLTGIKERQVPRPGSYSAPQ